MSSKNQSQEDNNPANIDQVQVATTNASARANVRPEPETRAGGIKDFIAQTNIIGNVIAAAASQKNSFEPLPYTDYALFEENYDADKLKINVNPCSTEKYVFIPRTPITVTVTAERKHGAHIFHPYLYTLQFKHDKFEWTVVRSYKEIKEVHKALAKLAKADLGQSCSDISKDDIKKDWPLFPTEHDHLVPESQISDRCKKLGEYLQRLLRYPPYRDNPLVLTLLGVSPLSFIKDISPSLIEDLLQKRTGDNVYYGHLSELKICCEKVKIFHAKRWFCLKDTYIVYTNPENNNLVGYVMLVDRAFRLKTGLKTGTYHGIQIKNLQRTLVLKFKNSQQQNEWYDKIQYMLENTGKCFNSELLLTHGSYAPVRKSQMCRWYVNASQYMEHVMHGLNNAKEEIYITDWWLCPELFLKRPTDDLQYRLDKILLKKARDGVKVYILLFKEVALALGLLSSRAKNILTMNGKNPNIKVLRHPEHSPAGVFLWSHHEKCVIIDQSIAFMGGIDLCFGRWDDDMHRLVDLGRRENITEIDVARSSSSIPIANTSRIISDLQRLAREETSTEPPEDVPQAAAPMERTDTEFQLQSSSPPPEVARAMENNTISLEQANAIVSAEPRPEDIAPSAEPAGAAALVKADALLVAALMGVRLNKNRKKVMTQMSAPTGVVGAAPAHDARPISVPPSEKLPRPQKAIAGGEEKTNNLEMSTLKPDDVKFDTVSNASSSKNNTSGAKLNTSTSRAAGSSKASKLLTRFYHQHKLNKKMKLDVVDASYYKSNEYLDDGGASKGGKSINESRSPRRFFTNRFKNDMSVPTNDVDEDGPDDGSTSKKDRVKKKWNRLKKTVKKKGETKLNKLRRHSADSSFDHDSDESQENESEQENELNVVEHELPVISNEGYYWIGKDYANTYKQDFKDVGDFSKDQFDRSVVPRMPWRDEALVMFGECARDLARHFIQRWNQCKREKVRQIAAYPFLLPKSYTEPVSCNYQDWFKDQLFKCSIQVTRSLEAWSGGISTTETSILNAYCELIQNAQHFIYIENQFFVTTADPAKDTEVKNSIGLELVKRIKRAHEEKKKFRVYIVLPLLPGFDSQNAIQAVQYYNLRSIKLGEYSIYRELQKAGITDPTEYITFHGMRNWAVLMGNLVQEIIYVHSKLMIVDDKHVICGSANINDRSLLGKRDSELASVISDEEFVTSQLNGQKCQVGKYAFSLRQKIFKLHLGIYFNNPDRIDVSDCVSDEFYNLFRSISHKNTIIYDEVFKCLPSDKVLTFEDLKNYATRDCLVTRNPVEGKHKLEKNVSGFVVDFPLDFLSQEKNFFPDLNTPEGMVPTAMWT